MARLTGEYLERGAIMLQSFTWLFQYSIPHLRSQFTPELRALRWAVLWVMWRVIMRSRYADLAQTGENPLPILREKAQTVLNVCAPNVQKVRAMTNEL
jgi:hypothetical protein